MRTTCLPFHSKRNKLRILMNGRLGGMDTLHPLRVTGNELEMVTGYMISGFRCTAVVRL